MLKVALYGYGYPCETAQDGSAALAKINQTPDRFRLIITDLRMPGVDGFSLIERSRAAGYSGAFMIYAGSIAWDDHQRLRELKVDSVIAKPARPRELHTALLELDSES